MVKKKKTDQRMKWEVKVRMRMWSQAVMRLILWCFDDLVVVNGDDVFIFLSWFTVHDSLWKRCGGEDSSFRHSSQSHGCWLGVHRPGKTQIFNDCSLPRKWSYHQCCLSNFSVIGEHACVCQQCVQQCSWRAVKSQKPQIHRSWTGVFPTLVGECGIRLAQETGKDWLMSFLYYIM